MSCNSIEYRADELLKIVQPNATYSPSQIDVEYIFDNYLQTIGFKTGYIDLSHKNAEGYTNAVEKEIFVDKKLLNDASIHKHMERRLRSTVAHEIGHALLHVPLMPTYISIQQKGGEFMRDREDLKPYEDPEWQAWHFANCLIMPAAMVRTVAYESMKYEVISNVARVFNVNEAFARTRLRKLNIPYVGA
jgi:Zn-dependent peptidase ImmA (M78 family)